MLVYNAREDLLKWASDIIFGEDSNGFDMSCEAIGVVLNDRLIAAVVYSNHSPRVNMEMSIASIDKRWASRSNLNAFFSYPFIQLDLKRVSTQCSAKEGSIIEFNKRLGFKPEGYHREAWHAGGDVISFGMLKGECRYLNYGKTENS